MYLSVRSYEIAKDESGAKELQANLDLAYKLKDEVIANHEPHLVDCNLFFIFRDHEVEKGDKIIFATVGKVRSILKHFICNIENRNVDFMIEIDYNRWKAVSDVEKKKLIHHELLHIRTKPDADNPEEPMRNKAGDIVYKLIKHDIEEFIKVNELYTTA